MRSRMRLPLGITREVEVLYGGKRHCVQMADEPGRLIKEVVRSFVVRERNRQAQSLLWEASCVL